MPESYATFLPQPTSNSVLNNEAFLSRHAVMADASASLVHYVAVTPNDSAKGEAIVISGAGSVLSGTSL